MATVTRPKSRRAPATVVYLLPVADAIEAQKFDSSFDALNWEQDFNEREKKRPDRKYIAVADVEHVIRPRRSAAKIEKADADCVYLVRFVNAAGEEVGERKLLLPDSRANWIGNYNSLSHVSGISAESKRIPLPAVNGQWIGGAQ